MLLCNIVKLKKKISGKDWFTSPNLYVKCTFNKISNRTMTIQSTNPKWNQMICFFDLNHEDNNKLTIELYEENTITSDNLLKKEDLIIPGNLEELKEFICANVIIKCKFFEVMSLKGYNQIITINNMLREKNIEVEEENKCLMNENSELRKKMGIMERILYKMDDKLSKVKLIVNDSIDTALIGVNTLRYLNIYDNDNDDDNDNDKTREV